MDTKAAVLLLALATAGSTCRGQSAGGDVAAAGSAADKPAPVDVNLPGVDTSALTPRERREWNGYIGELLAPCPDIPVSIAQCVLERRACGRCLPAARFVLKAVRDGMSREQVEKAYHNRFDPARVKDVPIDGSPTRGPESAPITLVEFADFECAHCATLYPMLESAYREHKSEMRFVFKFLPLAIHTHAEAAARAAIAAMQQGKFWEIHHKLFENQKRLDESDLEGYAKELGLDVARFRAAMASPATSERLAKDKKLADSLEVKGTPTIFINGREFSGQQDLTDWLSLEPASGAPPADAGAARGTDGATGALLPAASAAAH